MPNISHINKTPEQEAKMPGVEVRDTTIQWLITKENAGAPNFAMRRFVIKPGGYIEMHSHPNEHEIFILSGKGVMLGPKGKDIGEKNEVSEGNFIFVPGNEPHGYRNDGDRDFVLLCMTPNPA